MTLKLAARQILDAAQSAPLENLDGLLKRLSESLGQDLANEDLHGVQKILEDARNALYVRRAHTVRALQQNRCGNLYLKANTALNSWEFSG